MSTRLITLSTIAVALIAAGWYAHEQAESARLDAASTQPMTTLRGAITVLPEVLVRAPRPRVLESDHSVSATLPGVDDGILPSCADTPLVEAGALPPNRRDESLTQPCNGPIVLSAVEVRAPRPRSTALAAASAAAASAHPGPTASTTTMEGFRVDRVWSEPAREAVLEMPFFDFSGVLR